MSKLKLDHEALEVESFDTEVIAGQQGTVRGHASHPTICPGQDTCFGETCFDSCATCDTCDPYWCNTPGPTCAQSCIVENCTFPTFPGC